MFGCMARHKPSKDCRWDYDSYTCNLCTKAASDEDLGYHVLNPSSDDWLEQIAYYESLDDDDSQKDLDIGLCSLPGSNIYDTNWICCVNVGLCGVVPLSSYRDNVPTTRDECWGSGPTNIKPSIGTDGRFCVCVRPNESYDVGTVHEVSSEEFESFVIGYVQHHQEAEEDTSSMKDLHELYQSDFDHGTYRILKRGTYKIMEDVTFDFNAGDLDDPNVGSSWWPTSDQSDQYPGAASTRGRVLRSYLKYRL